MQAACIKKLLLLLILFRVIFLLSLKTAHGQPLFAYTGEKVSLGINITKEYSFCRWEIYCDFNVNFAKPSSSCQNHRYSFINNFDNQKRVELIFNTAGRYFVKAEVWDSEFCTNNLKLFTVDIDESEKCAVICPPDIKISHLEKIPPLPTTIDDFREYGGYIDGDCTIYPKTFTATQSESTGIDPKFILRTYSILIHYNSIDSIISCGQTIIISHYDDWIEEPDLFIPEGFSPNSDGVHDYFHIYNIEKLYPNSTLRIFDLSGNKIFEKHHYGNCSYWGGPKNAWWWGLSENYLTKKRSPVPQGAYIYILNTGTKENYKGVVMVLY